MRENSVRVCIRASEREGRFFVGDLGFASAHDDALCTISISTSKAKERDDGDRLRSCRIHTNLFLPRANMTLALLTTAAAALLCPSTKFQLHRPSLVPHRASVLRLVEEDAAATSETPAWPTPARSADELRAEAEANKEAAEAASLANPKPFIEEGGGFSVVAALTVVVFVIGGFSFFNVISGGGAVGMLGGDQSPEVQECIRKATTVSVVHCCMLLLLLPLSLFLSSTRSARSVLKPASACRRCRCDFTDRAFVEVPQAARLP